MKIFILTSVALFAEYGDLDSLDNPSVSVSVHTSLQKAQVQMKNELQTEKEEAKAGGYDNFSTKIEEKSASYQQGEIGSGCSYNLVTWEITEKEVFFPKKHRTVTAYYDGEEQVVFIAEANKQKAFWWTIKGSHLVHFTEGEPFELGAELMDVQDDDAFTYYGNGTNNRPDNVADMETFLWLLRDKE